MVPIPIKVVGDGKPRYTPKKRALLIGINYDMSGFNVDVDFARLVTPQKDVEEFRRLLLDVYGFKEEDIVVMTDKRGTEWKLLPRRDHIIREIRHLVSDPQPGDDFVFLYSGHSDQLPNKTGTEDDEMDEIIVPMDHKGVEEDTIIVDNELRQLLVEPLPAGCRLTAIFDACHSGTLLDLKHYTCNNFFRPLPPQSGPRSRGVGNRAFRSFSFSSPSQSSVRIYQKKSNETSMRKNSIDLVPSSGVPAPTNPALAQRVLANKSNTPTKPALPNHPAPSKSTPLEHHRGLGLGLVNTPMPAVDFLPRPIPPFSLGEAAAALDPELADEDKENQIEMTPRPRPSLKLDFEDDISMPRCSSPAPMSDEETPRECVGHCLPSPTLRPMVLSISACNDSQITYEDVEGEASSLIQAIIQVLRRESTLPIGEFMTNLGAILKQAAQRRIQAFREDRAQEWKTHGAHPDTARDAIALERSLKNQNPQLGSDKPLKNTDMFTL